MGRALAAEVASLLGDLSPLSPPSRLVSQSSFMKLRNHVKASASSVSLCGLQKNQVLGVTG